MTSNLFEKFQEQCSRVIIYKTNCPDLMRLQCIKEQFDGDAVAYRHWVNILKHYENNHEKVFYFLRLIKNNLNLETKKRKQRCFNKES